MSPFTPLTSIVWPDVRRPRQWKSCAAAVDTGADAVNRVAAAPAIHLLVVICPPEWPGT
jgi:hypothetical protein